MATSRQTSKAAAAAKDYAEKSEVDALKSKLASLEKLCSALQNQCNTLKAELQAQKSSPVPASAPSGDAGLIDSLERRVSNTERKLSRLLPKR